MSGTDSASDVRELDVRDVGGEPFGHIVTALNDLPPEAQLVLVNSFEPEPLYDVLEQRGFEYRARRVGPDEWRVTIEHRCP